MTLTSLQRDILKCLYLGGRCWLIEDEPWTEDAPVVRVAITRSIHFHPGGKPEYCSGFAIGGLIQSGAVSVPKKRSVLSEVTLTDKGAKAIGHDTAAARKVEKVSK